MLKNDGPTGPDTLGVVERALEWIADGKSAALAVVVETWGSSPRPAGSLLAVNADTNFEGSVSGGCVEGDVVTQALALMKEGGFKVLEYGITDEDAWSVGLACGGRLKVFVAAVTEPWHDALQALVRARQEKTPAALVIDIEDGTPGVTTGNGADPALAADIADAIRTDESHLVTAENGYRRFIGVFNPPLRMLIVGAVHIAQALAPMARTAGFDVTVIDPRGAWATADRFPGIAIDSRWPGEAMAGLALDRRTAVVSLSHDPKLDDPALIEALGSDAFYIGALGSRRTHAKRLGRLGAAGVDEAALARIHSPVGIDIGAETPAEIAVAITAEAVATLRRGRA